MSKVISRDTINRLLKDVKQIIKNPLTSNGIYYVHDESDMMKGYAMIVGPEDTPYFGGFYFFELNYPHDYPHSPPKAVYYTNGNNVRFNPNLYKCGKVCISLLNTWAGDQWTSCQSITSVLLSLCTLLCKDPLLNEPGVNSVNRDFHAYNQIIDYANLDIAVCDIVTKKEGVYNDFFNVFYPFVKEHFLKNYDKLLEISQKLFAENPSPQVLKTSLYLMNITLDYENLVNKLENSKKLMDSI
jgi:ubiquitin-conjugating enzyme E2 Z